MKVDDEQSDYNRVAAAIAYISENHLAQPSLEKVAAETGLSPFHFQKLFTRWAGVSPKKFLQLTTLNYAKDIIKSTQASLFETAIEAGLSGSGRLHDLFVNIEAMTPGEYKNGGESLKIEYYCHNTIFGKALMARTSRGICHLSFVDENSTALSGLFSEFPKATFCEKDHYTFTDAVNMINTKVIAKPLQLHISGSVFQLKVWQALLSIPEGQVTTYGTLATQLGFPGASRSVGTAIGKNPIAVLIPCHRVIRASGLMGGYRWGLARKKIILARERMTGEAQENHSG